MYGGAAGGGKSIALLAAALMFVQTKGYAALLLRRRFSDLMQPKALIPLSHEWLSNTDAKWQAQEKQWVFPSGAVLKFGYCDTDKDVYQFQGAEFTFVGWDELTQFPKHWYLYLFSRLRKPENLHVPLRVRSATNPGNIGHDWVQARFIKPPANHKGEWKPAGPFIPAKLTENPHLNQEEYNASLELLDVVTRCQLQQGDWDIRPEGNLFKTRWFSNRVYEYPKNLTQVVRFWDMAATAQSEESPDPDWTVGTKIGRLDDSTYVVLDVKRFRATAGEVEQQIKQTAARDGRGVSIRMEQEPGSAGKTVALHYGRVLDGYDFRAIPAHGDKVTRAQPFSAACERGDVLLLESAWIEEWMNELCAFPVAAHDDQVDSVVGAYNALAGASEVWTRDDLKQFLPEYA